MRNIQVMKQKKKARFLENSKLFNERYLEWIRRKKKKDYTISELKIDDKYAHTVLDRNECNRFKGDREVRYYYTITRKTRNK